MITYTGKAAMEIMAKAGLAYPPNDGIYDYSLKHGMVIIRKDDARCLYMRRRAGGAAIVFEGSPEEFEGLADALGVADESEIREMLETASFYK